MKQVRQNLWNVDYTKGTNTKKTKNVMQYIKELEPPDTYNREEKMTFNKIRETALKQEKPDEMLKKIGYSPTKQDGIFYWSKQGK